MILVGCTIVGMLICIFGATFAALKRRSIEKWVIGFITFLILFYTN